MTGRIPAIEGLSVNNRAAIPRTQSLPLHALTNSCETTLRARTHCAFEGDAGSEIKIAE